VPSQGYIGYKIVVTPVLPMFGLENLAIMNGFLLGSISRPFFAGIE
jgi:hypothetical protein